MFDYTMRGFVIENFSKRNGIDIIKYKCYVLVMLRVFILSSNEADIFNTTSIKGSCVTLVGKIYLIIIASFENKTHIFAKKELVLNTISIWNNKNALWNL
jgi:hypothetical protein